MSSSRILSPTSICPETWKPILWREWQRHGKHLLKIITAYIILFFIIPFDENGVLLLISTLVSGQLLAIVLGGSDVAEGSESYAFILPLRRADYFWARYLAGLSILSLLTGISYLLMTFDLHQHFWGLFTETGLARESILIYPAEPIGNFIFCAILGYSTTFCFSASARNAGVLAGCWFLGLAGTYGTPAVLLAIFGFIYHINPQPYIQGAPFIYIALAFSALTLLNASRSYCGKNVSSGNLSSSKGIGVSGWLLIIFILFVVIGFIS